MTHQLPRYLLLLSAALVGFGFSAKQPTDPDLGWHLMGGAWIWEHKAVPSADFINLFRKEWHDYHWLGQLLLYAGYQSGGYELLRWGLGAVVAAILYALTITATSCNKRAPYLAVIPLCFSTYFLWTIGTVRPQMLALLLVALAQYVILKRTRYELLALFALATLSVNIHVYWIFIPILWFLYRCLPRLYRKRAVSPIYAWGGLFLLIAAGLISPYGLLGFDQSSTPTQLLLNYALIWDYLGIPEVLYRTVGEFRSPLAFRGSLPFIVLSYLALACRLLPSWKRILAQLPAFLALIVGVYLSLSSAKYLGILAILGIPFTIMMLSKRYHLLFRKKVVPFWVPFWGALLAALGFVLSSNPITIPTELVGVPDRACGRVAELIRDIQTPVRILTHFDSGGWCRWIVYERDPAKEVWVTTDNRTQGLPDELFRKSFDLYSVRNDWAHTLLEWNPDFALVPRALPLAQVLLLAQGQWALVYDDAMFWVFRKAQG